MRLFGFLFLFIFFVLPIAFVGFLILKIAKKTMESEWKGEIIDKLYRIKEETDEGKRRTSHFYTLVVKTDEGLTRKIAVSKEMYDSCQIGG